MSSKSGESQERSGLNIKVEIQRTLISIDNTTRNIKNELNAINALSEKNGQLHTAVIDANRILTKVAGKMDINIKNILRDDEENGEVAFQLENALSSSLQEQILQCLNKI